MMDTKYALLNNCVEGDLLIDIHGDILTETFFCEIYQDAIRVVLNKEAAIQTIVSDNVAWEINAGGTVTSMIVFGQCKEIIKHTLVELSS